LPARRLPNSLVGMAGVFYACYELSRRGWYCLPTIRNTAGIDIVAYSLDGGRRITIQVKSLSRRNAVPMRKTSIPYDYLIIVRKVFSENPEVFIMTREEAESRVTKTTGRRGETQYWLELRDYEPFKDRWDLIGTGYHQ
jgi:hypothetical protein